MDVGLNQEQQTFLLGSASAENDPLRTFPDQFADLTLCSITSRSAKLDPSPAVSCIDMPLAVY